MDWGYVSKILSEGTPEQIKAVRCPECGGELKAVYFPETRSTNIDCLNCFTIVRAHGAYKTPNFALLKS